MNFWRFINQEIRLVPKKQLKGSGPFFTDNYEFRVLRITVAPGDMIYDIYYDHGKTSVVYKDRVKFYMDSIGPNQIKSMSTGRIYLEKDTKRMIDILITADYELRRTDNVSPRPTSFNIVEDDLSDKLDRLGL